LGEEEASTAVSSAVSKVISECVAEMRADPEVDAPVIDRFEELLRRGTVPKPEELVVALFGVPPDVGS